MPYTDLGRVGYQTSETSEIAARSMDMSAATIRVQVLELLRDTPAGLTADEAAAKLGMSVLSIRPRVTELRRDRLIVATGERRRNASGRLAAVYAWW